MTQPTFRKAEKQKAKLRLALIAPSGYGKTYSALLIARGLGGKIAMIDTENGSGDLYSDKFDYDILTLQPPYTPEKYIEAIKAAERAEYSTIIIDSLSHVWAGEGGLLDQQGKIADTGKNSFSAWRTITPKHNVLVESMLHSSSHIIATMRAKQDYVIEDDEKGRKTVKKVGLAPVQRDGVEYEFTVVMELYENHNAKASKDRTTLFDNTIFLVTEDTGTQLKNWLLSGKEVPVDNTRLEPTPEQYKLIENFINSSSKEESEKKALIERLHISTNRAQAQSFIEKNNLLEKQKQEDKEFKEYLAEKPKEEDNSPLPADKFVSDMQKRLGQLREVREGYNVRTKEYKELTNKITEIQDSIEKANTLLTQK